MCGASSGPACPSSSRASPTHGRRGTTGRLSSWRRGTATTSSRCAVGRRACWVQRRLRAVLYLPGERCLADARGRRHCCSCCCSSARFLRRAKRLRAGDACQPTCFGATVALRPTRVQVGADDDGYAVRLRMQWFLEYCQHPEHGEVSHASVRSGAAAGKQRAWGTGGRAALCVAKQLNAKQLRQRCRHTHALVRGGGCALAQASAAPLSFQLQPGCRCSSHPAPGAAPSLPPRSLAGGRLAPLRV